MTSDDTRADPNELAIALRHAYEVTQYGSMGTVDANPITEEQVQRVLRMTQPLYDILNGEAPLAPSLDNASREKYMDVLREIGLEFSYLQPISMSGKPDLGPDLQWLIEDKDWQNLIMNKQYDHSPVELILNELMNPEPSVATSGASLQSPGDHILGLCNQEGYQSANELIDTFAELLVLPAERLPTGEQTAALIERLFPFLVKWPILGFKPGDPATLCILVA